MIQLFGAASEPLYNWHAPPHNSHFPCSKPLTRLMGDVETFQFLDSWWGQILELAHAVPRALGTENEGSRYETRLGIGICPGLAPFSPRSHFTPYQFFLRTLPLIIFTWLCVLGSTSRAKEHYQIIEKPCGFIASKKKNDLLHILNLKKSCKLVFQEENLKEKKNILRSGITRSSQANTSAKLPMRSPRGCQTSQGHCELWVWAGAGRGHVPRARLLHLPRSSTGSQENIGIPSRCSSGQMHICTLDISKGRTWPLNLINQLYQFPNITHNAFNNTLCLFTQIIELRKHDQTALAVQAITLLGLCGRPRSHHFGKNNNSYLL